MSKSCSLVRMLSLLSGCMRVGRLCSSSPNGVSGLGDSIIKRSQFESTHQFPSGYNRTLPSTTSAPSLYLARRFPAETSLSSRCCCETPRGSRAENKRHSQPSSERGRTLETRRGTTERHSGKPRQPLFAFLPSWTPGSGSLWYRDFAWWLSAAAWSYRSAVCCWTGRKCSAKRTRIVGCASSALLLQPCAVPQALPGLSAVHSPALTATVTWGVVAAYFEVSQRSVMNVLGMRGRDCD